MYKIKKLDKAKKTLVVNVDGSLYVSITQLKTRIEFFLRHYADISTKAIAKFERLNRKLKRIHPLKLHNCYLKITNKYVVDAMLENYELPKLNATVTPKQDDLDCEQSFNYAINKIYRTPKFDILLGLPKVEKMHVEQPEPEFDDTLPQTKSHEITFDNYRKK